MDRKRQKALQRLEDHHNRQQQFEEESHEKQVVRQQGLLAKQLLLEQARGLMEDKDKLRLLRAQQKEALRRSCQEKEHGPDQSAKKHQQRKCFDRREHMGKEARTIIAMDRLAQKGQALSVGKKGGMRRKEKREGIGKEVGG
eukprot:CAMPEP_0173070506 /NCGR_PEP_ID=MMETSP1102-20130122/8667_1 /TAXON_ID=49646 /ORGANISM="Geminigera sp., Strain Caron Lab Isolate" /LENGTH=141 /DNA_ID=CAMNT_0013938807 /DNA_START=371 /DNA_END=792 /DNA_ORIENTATION=+